MGCQEYALGSVYYLGHKAPSLKMLSFFFHFFFFHFRRSFFGITFWTLIGSRHLCCLLITCKATEPEQVATSDLEHSYDL